LLDARSSSALRPRVRMTAREIDEPHRVSSQLELLFDLVFVVAIASATTQLARSIANGDALVGLLPFLQVFFSIWWAWMNFTWFSSAYDTDDVASRLLTMLQMAGVLVLAAGVPTAAGDGDYRAVALGYVIMRIGLVCQWLRAGLQDPGSRRTALRYATGIAVAQIGWLGWLALSFTSTASSEVARVPSFVALVAVELVIPRWAERTGPTSWHPHHIAERYGLFTIILLGEVVSAATTAVQQAMSSTRLSGSLIVIAGSAIALVFTLWWLYFLYPAGPGLADRRHRSYYWGYGHYAVFAAFAALGSGLDVSVHLTAGHVRAAPTAVSYAVAIPTSVVVVSIWAVHAAIATTSAVQCSATLACSATILLLPLVTPWAGVAAVIGVITLVCVLLTVLTSCGPDLHRTGQRFR
jgi:low temperature requirement protein LtrA